MALSLDALTAPREPARPPARPRRPAPAMPPEAPLPMPVQRLARWDRGDGAPAGARPQRRALARPRLRLRRRRRCSPPTAPGRCTRWCRSRAAPRPCSTCCSACSPLNFSWIALAFTSALLGFLVLLRRRRSRPPCRRGSPTRTAVVMPVYNEATARTFAASRRCASRDRGHRPRRGLRLLRPVGLDASPTPGSPRSAPSCALRERARAATPGSTTATARRTTTARPATSRDFVTRWGGAYEHMLVLDADSLMTGDCIVRARRRHGGRSGCRHHPVAAADHQPQHAVRPASSNSPPASTGPVIATGLAVWSGRDGNYWGHNAIIRTRAFAAHCGLPDLPGKPPFGGHILSHDFVEAALIRRAGWTRVHAARRCAGSYEESPPSLIDLAVRDRRWCQGNLQHSRVIGARGPDARLRASTSPPASSATSPRRSGSPSSWSASRWCCRRPTSGRNISPREFRLFPVWPRFDPERALQLFGADHGHPARAEVLRASSSRCSTAPVRRACGGGDPPRRCRA